MAVNKIDPKVIFASEAPAQDTPAVFTNRTVGWGETRKNGGRPTIKQMNAEQQSTDLKILWLNENAVTPYDSTIDYPPNAVTIKDGEFKIINDGVWETFLDRNHSSLTNRDVASSHPASAISDVSGKTQQELNDKSKAYFGKTVTPEQFKGPFELDDTNSCIQAWQWANTNKGMVKLDAKIYEVNSALPPLIAPAAIVGAGERLTFIKYGVGAIGPCISTQDVSFHSSGPTFLDQNSNTIDIENEKSGVILDGFSIVGDRTSTNVQSGIIHYGLTDNLIIGTVGVHNIKGVGWGSAYVANPSNSTGIRESCLGHIIVRRCGDQVNDIPAIDYFTTGYEPSNAVTIERLDSIWPDGCAARFKNTSFREDLGWGRFIRILSGMLHGREDSTSNPQTKPLLEVSGRWYANQFNFTEINGGRDGVFNVHMHKGSMTAGPRQCEINSAIGGSNGVYIEHGRDITVDCSTISLPVGGVHLKVGPDVLGNVFLSGSSEDLQYSRLNIINQTSSVNKVIKTKRGGPFLVDRSSTKNSSAGGLMATADGDGLRLGLLNDSGVAVTTALEILRYAGKTAGDVDIELALSFAQNGIVFGDRNVKSDEPRQVYFESRSGLNLLIIQRTNYAGRKAITWNNSIPVGGVWNVGDICYNSGASLGGASGWIYTTGGWQVLSQSGTPTSTTANMSSLAQSVNTASKFATKQVINSTDNKMYYATGGLASDVWRSFDGVNTVTPV